MKKRKKVKPLVVKVDLPAPVAPEQVKVAVKGKTLYVQIHDWWERMTT